MTILKVGDEGWPKNEKLGKRKGFKEDKRSGNGDEEGGRWRDNARIQRKNGPGKAVNKNGERL